MTGPPPGAIAEFLRRAPKAEVHVHLEGALGEAFLADRARLHGRSLAGRRALELRLPVRSAEAFFPLFRWVVEEHLRRPEDYAAAVREAAGALAAANVRYAELTLSAGALLFFGRPLLEILHAVDEAASAVTRAGGPELRFVADGVRGHGPDPLGRVLEVLRPLSRSRWPALGLAGAEGAMPARPFADVFADARAAGLAADVHAGEEGGPERIWEVLEHLRPDRLVHAVSAAADSALVAHLRARRLPLALNPTSNVCTGAVASLREHPLRRFLRAGLVVSVNTDDPALFGSTLPGELLAVA
ncbi:MAG: adenosine deaminase [Gemmatimonadota bacterium]